MLDAPIPSKIRESILAARDFQVEPLDPAPWGIPNVGVRTMSGIAREKWENTLVASSKGEISEANLRGTLVCLTLCVNQPDTPVHGTLVFRPEDAAAVGGKSAEELMRIFAIATRLNGLNSTDEAQKN